MQMRVDASYIPAVAQVPANISMRDVFNIGEKKMKDENTANVARCVERLT
jgi:hypothetical protein